MSPEKIKTTFHSRVTKSDTGCWLFTTLDSGTGYGRIGKSWAHRVSWELHVGPIPAGLQIDHLCRVHACVNPDHLEPVTPGENVRRGNSPTIVARREGRCIKAGHPLTPENCASNGRTGAITCRTCKQERERARWHRLREAGQEARAERNSDR